MLAACCNFLVVIVADGRFKCAERIFLRRSLNQPGVTLEKIPSWGQR